jgi:hypothetical protein
MTADDLARIAQLVDHPDELDDLLHRLHRKYHVHPIDHVRVHRVWIRTALRRNRYFQALFHVFAGYVAAVPASLVQRYTGLVVPAFDDTRS